MNRLLILIFALDLITISSNFGQSTPVEKGLEAITHNAISAQLGFLASDWTEGRAAGEKGEYLSADYIASMLQLIGVKPGGDQSSSLVHNNMLNLSRSYFQNFVLLKSIPGEEQILKVKSIKDKTLRVNDFTSGIDYSVRNIPADMEIEAPVVFTGYGFKNDKLKYNDFNNLDLKGKFIMKIKGIPEFAKGQLTQPEISESEGKIEEIAKRSGAVGIIEIYINSAVIGPPPRKDFLNISPSEEFPRPALSYDLSIPGKANPDNLIRIKITIKTANEILKGTGIVLEDYIKKADANTIHVVPPIAGKTIYLKSSLKTSLVAVRNIIGIIEGNNRDEVIILGAHYDHLGMNNGYIWNGADDNGSGTVGVMTIAKAIMESGKKPEKTIIIALWTAEEEGLLGSKYWVENPTCPLKDVKLYVNFDMISRYVSDKEPSNVVMTYSSSCPGFKDITIANLGKYSIDLNVNYQPSDNPAGGSDHRSFVAEGIPIMRFKPGHREEYHTYNDELGTIDWDIMEKIIRISFLNVWELANSNW